MIDLLVQLLWLAALSLAATAVFCFRLRRIAAIGAVGAVLLAYSVLSPAPVWLQVVLWVWNNGIQLCTTWKYSHYESWVLSGS